MPHTSKSQISSHTKGTHRGEEVIQQKGPEPGREHGGRTARDSTSIDPKTKGPIDPRMPNLPPP